MVVSSASVWVRRGSSLPETQEPSPLAKLSLKQVVDARWDKFFCKGSDVSGSAV